jgi:hypothetical protein
MGQIFGPDELAAVGQAGEACLAFAVSMRASDAATTRCPSQGTERSVD